jgi:PAS domain S-box-containing protein
VRHRVEETTLTTVRAMAAAADARFLQIATGLQALALSPALAQGDVAAFERQARDFLAVNSIALNIVLIDKQGNQVLNTLAPAGAPPSGTRSRPELIALLDHGDMAVTDLFAGPVLGKPIMAVGVPRRDGGKVSYVVAAGIRPRELSSVLVNPKLPDAWTEVLLDRKRVIVARIPSNDDFIGQPPSKDMSENVAKRSEGTFFGLTREGVPVMAVFSRAAVSGYVVGVGVPEQEILGQARRTAAILAVFMCALLAIVLAFALSMSRRITGAVKELASMATTDLGRRNASFGSDSVFREADQMRIGLNIATAELQQADADLKRMSRELADDTLRELRGIIEAATEPMLVLDEDSRIVAANAAASDFVGMPIEKLVGRHSFGDLIMPAPELGADNVVRVMRGDDDSIDALVHDSTFRLGDRELVAVSLRAVSKQAA